MSKLSFQYGFRVFLITPVVFVCSPLTVATANGSGKPERGSARRVLWIEAIRTEDITLVEAIGGNDYGWSGVREG